MNSGSSSGCSTSSPSKWLPTPGRSRVLRSTSKMQRRPSPASAIERRNQLLPVPAPPRTAITSRCWRGRSEEHTSELQSRSDLVCRLLLEKKKKKTQQNRNEQKTNIVSQREDNDGVMERGRRR